MADAAQPTSAEAWVENSLFEGLFRAIPATPAMAPQLRAAGYDPANPQPRYRSSVWRAVIEVVRSHAFPALDKNAGTRAVGRRLVDGFFQTIIGKLVAVSLPMLAGNHAQRRIPGMFKMVRKDLVVRSVEESPERFRLIVEDPSPLPEFLAGFLEGVGHASKRPTVVKVENERPGGYDLLLTTLAQK